MRTATDKCDLRSKISIYIEQFSNWHINNRTSNEPKIMCLIVSADDLIITLGSLTVHHFAWNVVMTHENIRRLIIRSFCWHESNWSGGQHTHTRAKHTVMRSQTHIVIQMMMQSGTQKKWDWSIQTNKHTKFLLWKSNWLRDGAALCILLTITSKVGD